MSEPTGRRIFVLPPEGAPSKAESRRADRARAAFWPFRAPAYRDLGFYACLLLGLLVGNQSVSQGLSDGDPKWLLPLWGFVWPVLAFLGAARFLSAIRRSDASADS